MLVGLLQFGFDRSAGFYSWPDERHSGWAVNYGDILVSEALHKIFKSGEHVFGSFVQPFPVRPDVIVLRGSTYLHNYFDYDAACDVLDQYDCPIVTVGLGAQSAQLDPSFLDGNRGARNFLARLSQRSKSISVRGRFTAEVCKRLGATKVRLTGCPSLFYQASGQPRIDLQTLAGQATINPGVCIHTELTGDHFCSNPKAVLQQHGKVMRRMFSDYPGFSIFEQGNLQELLVSDKRLPYRQRLVVAAALARKIGLHESLADRLASRFVRLTNTNNWLAKVADCDVMVGFRFHGVVAALCQGIPSFLFSYDSRMREFCALYGLPSAGPDSEVNPVRAALNHDWSHFNRAMSFCYAEFREFYRENALAGELEFFTEDVPDQVGQCAVRQAE